jgi:protein required for attachment to host cells
MTRSTATKSVMKPRRRAKLPEAPPMDRKFKRTLIVVADGARARFFEPEGGKLVAARHPDMTAPLARRLNQELVTDKPGRGFSNARDGRRSGMEPPHDPHKMEKHKFSAELAQAIDAASQDYDRLVLVAPKRSLGELRGLLSKRAQGAVTHEVPKDLTGSNPQALWKALSAALPM